MIAAPALLAVSSVAYAAGTGFSADQLGGTLQVYAMAVYPLALLGLTRRLERVRPRAAAVLSAIAVLGTAGGVTFGVDAVHAAVHPEGPMREFSVAPAILFIPGLFFPLAFIGIGIALAQSGAAPRWAGYGLALGGVLFPLSRIPRVIELALASDLLIFAALAPLGWALLTGRRASNATSNPAGSTSQHPVPVASR